MEPCQIMYSEDYLSTMSTLKEYLENKTYTEEALQVTEDALNFLASHYTAWCFRWDVIKHLKKDLFDELDWCEEVALENEKNYQIWNYRQRVIELIMLDPEKAACFQHRREYPIIQTMLSLDAKNHHVWLYRNWYVQRFNLFDDVEELTSVTAMIDKDARNNSAWNHRFFLIFNRNCTSDATIEEEIRYTQDKIALCPQNPSSWNYLLGIYRQTEKLLVELKSLCTKYADLSKEKISSSFALETLAEIAVLEKNSDRACQCYYLLLLKYDPIRASYWKYLLEKLE